MVARESRLTNQRFCRLRVPLMLIHSVTTVAEAQIQVTALVSKVTAHWLSGSTEQSDKRQPERSETDGECPEDGEQCPAQK